MKKTSGANMKDLAWGVLMRNKLKAKGKKIPESLQIGGSEILDPADVLEHRNLFDKSEEVKNLEELRKIFTSGGVPTDPREALEHRQLLAKVNKQIKETDSNRRRRVNQDISGAEKDIVERYKSAVEPSMRFGSPEMRETGRTFRHTGEKAFQNLPKRMRRPIELRAAKLIKTSSPTGIQKQVQSIRQTPAPSSKPVQIMSNESIQEVLKRNPSLMGTKPKVQQTGKNEWSINGVSFDTPGSAQAVANYLLNK